MELASVRDLKAELRSELAAGEAARGGGVTALVKARAAAPAGALALGVAAARRRGARGVRLAVRLDADGPAAAELLARLTERAAGEVDVRVTGPVHPLAAGPVRARRRRATRPLVPGVSVGAVGGTAGTLGALVRVGGEPGLLSAAHVLVAPGRPAPGAPVLQPGPEDGGRDPRDRVARLHAWSEPWSPGGDRSVDAASAVLDDPALAGENSVAGPRTVVPLRGVAPAPPLGARVVKAGRSTGWTAGAVSAVELDGVPVGYDVEGGGGTVALTGVFEVDGTGRGPFSRAGDSGAVVLEPDSGLGAGLLVAGSETGGRHGRGLTYACPLAETLAAVGAVLL